MLLTLWKVREAKIPLFAWKTPYEEEVHLDFEILSKVSFVENVKDIFEHNLRPSY